MAMASEFYFIRTKNGVKQFDLDDIMVLEANDNHVYFRKKNNKSYELIRITLDAALKQLPPGKFGRINRTFAVALKYVTEARKDVIIFKNRLRLEYTYYPTYWREFLKQLKIIESPRDNKNEQPE